MKIQRPMYTNVQRHYFMVKKLMSDGMTKEQAVKKANMILDRQ